MVDWRRIALSADSDPARQRPAHHPQRSRPGLCHRSRRGPPARARAGARARRSRRAARARSARGRRALAGRARRRRPDRVDERSACDIGGRGLHSRRRRRRAPSVRSAHRAQRAALAADHVHHRSAAVADALSTALYAASPDEIEAIAARFAGTVVWATDADGREYRLGSIARPGRLSSNRHRDPASCFAHPSRPVPVLRDMRQPLARWRASPCSSRRGMSGASASRKACSWPSGDILAQVLARISASFSRSVLAMKPSM